MKTWLVYWIKNGRIASLENTPENRKAMTEAFYLALKHMDASGTEHWEVLGPKRKPGKKRKHA